MPSLSKQKKDKISEQILAYLYSISPESQYTSKIAQEVIVRDEEFTKTLLQDLEKKKLVVQITKSPQGQDYSRRSRWRLSEKAYHAYKNLNKNS